MTSLPAFHSPEPEVRLRKAFATPFRNVIATARTCYSPKGIVDDDSFELAKYVPLARSIYEAGHHTTFQHAQFQFTLANVSRQFLWSFLHSHPFYNSEQVSQRYVAVEPGNYAVPPLDGPARELYARTVDRLFGHYRKLTDLLRDPCAAEYFRLFPARGKYGEKYEKPIRKRAMEAARYVLPVSMFAYLYHTISGITLLRYHRLSGQFDAPLEQRIVIGKMVDCLLQHDEGYREVLQGPLKGEDTPEHQYLAEFFGGETPHANPGFRRRFDDSLDGYTSKLVDYKVNAEAVFAEAVREVLGRTPEELPDDDAIALVLDPAHNRLLGESLILTTHGKISRAMYHPHYTFRRKLSHAADSQDQRHRMTPASRPILSVHMDDAPDYIVPPIVESDAEAARLYRESMEIAWDAYGRLRSMGVSQEFALYVLPNALSVRFTESADLLNLHHKHVMRLCYNAQEEIWNASLDEAKQISAVHPRIGRYLLPPCSIRHRAGVRPVCPEGDRYCGVKVWTLPIGEYRRLI